MTTCFDVMKRSAQLSVDHWSIVVQNLGPATRKLKKIRKVDHDGAGYDVMYNQCCKRCQRCERENSGSAAAQPCEDDGNGHCIGIDAGLVYLY